MNTLLISQTAFYIISSVAILAVGVALVIVLYYLICILRDTRNLSQDLKHVFHKTKNRLKKAITSISKKGIRIG